MPRFGSGRIILADCLGFVSWFVHVTWLPEEVFSPSGVAEGGFIRSGRPPRQRCKYQSNSSPHIPVCLDFPVLTESVSFLGNVPANRHAGWHRFWISKPIGRSGVAYDRGGQLSLGWPQNLRAGRTRSKNNRWAHRAGVSACSTVETATHHEYTSGMGNVTFWVVSRNKPTSGVSLHHACDEALSADRGRRAECV